ncbi:hypothetical protein DV735_g3138, partial [Chaetothyriales sp. CBS 134920]
MEEDQKRLQALSETLQKSQEDLETTVEKRQRLEAQHQENKAVKKEFDGLADDAAIYKLVGPVLLKQDKVEAVGAVDARLDYIGKEIARTEDRIKELQESSQKTQSEAVQLQQKIQTLLQAQATA